jgi:RimJ/RimL family protein N-acetyltransferase
VTEVVLRPATHEDSRRVWEWASDPETRAASFHSGPIPWSEHERWYAASLSGETRHLRIAEAGGAAVGLVRLDRMDGDATAAEIGVNLAPGHRGRGLAAPILLAARAEASSLGFARVVARIRSGNERSIRAFERAGFAFAGTERVAGVDARRYEALSS